jgi:hypothetical protein
MNPEEAQRDIWNDGGDLALQTIQELFQFALIRCHSEVKAMDTVFCGHVRLLSVAYRRPTRPTSISDHLVCRK